MDIRPTTYLQDLLWLIAVCGAVGLAGTAVVLLVCWLVRAIA